MHNYTLPHLQTLEAEAIHTIRETAAQFTKPVLLFSGGKDSITLLHLAQKAFTPAQLPFPLLHIDTGHNFPETLTFRDQHIQQTKTQLIIRTVQNTINQGRAIEEKGTHPSRNKLQTITLLDTIQEHQFTAALGGARRDEEKSRAKERFFSHRNQFGQWDPKNQRPELWNLYNGKMNHGEHFRIFPLSNWTELDIWQYIKHQNLPLPTLYYAHTRPIIQHNNTLLAHNPHTHPNPNQPIQQLRVRFRTVGDMTCTGAIPSNATTIDQIIQETTTTQHTERHTRADDQRSETAMEDRKKDGYF